jgi:hypothetical protein
MGWSVWSDRCSKGPPSCFPPMEDLFIAECWRCLGEIVHHMCRVAAMSRQIDGALATWSWSFSCVDLVPNLPVSPAWKEGPCRRGFRCTFRSLVVRSLPDVVIPVPPWRERQSTVEKNPHKSVCHVCHQSSIGSSICFLPVDNSHGPPCRKAL